MPKPIPITHLEIEKLDTLYEELSEIQFKMTDAVNTAKDQHGEDEIVVLRGEEKKEITVREKVLWLELFQLGEESEAAADLKKKYPGVFELKDAENAKVAEIRAYEVKSFGFDYRSMSLPNIIRLVRGLIRAEVRADAVMPEEEKEASV